MILMRTSSGQARVALGFCWKHLSAVGSVTVFARPSRHQLVMLAVFSHVHPDGAHARCCNNPKLQPEGTPNGTAVSADFCWSRSVKSRLWSSLHACDGGVRNVNTSKYMYKHTDDPVVV